MVFQHPVRGEIHINPGVRRRLAQFGRLRAHVIAGLLFAVAGCAPTGTGDIQPETFREPVARGAIARTHARVRPELERDLAVQHAWTIAALSEGATYPAAFKRRDIVRALTDPWAGAVVLEHHEQALAVLARDGGKDLSALRDLIASGTDRPSDVGVPAPVPAEARPDDPLSFVVSVLERADVLREQALAGLDAEDRRFLFEHAQVLVEEFTPQIIGSDDEAIDRARADLRFARLVDEQVDMVRLVMAAQVLISLSDPEWLGRLEDTYRSRPTLPESPPSVVGDVKAVRQTPFGLVVIGGAGENEYDLEDVAVLVDLGGNDRYRGAIAAAKDHRQGHRVVIDLAGDDHYQGAPLGLATGRLGVGFLFDRNGDDEYRLASGSGGAGVAGVGILIDMSGADVYMGAKLTQGAAVGGVGVLIDMAGHDRFTGYGYALGFGGPLGVGLAVDVEGNDQYRCGDVYPSSYNATDAPDSQPGDPLFQYEGFCLGVGTGKRVLTKDRDQLRYGLAGGWGLLLDLAGDDRYRSANFSQGTGYFFGAGVKLDGQGNDDHHAARYGHGAAAHHGIGMFTDASGDDHYSSSGPLYNGAAAWDKSAAFFVDAGDGVDVYDVSRSDGLGRADHSSLSVFVDEGGQDRYLVPHGMGAATENSVSAFFDLGGTDDYGASSSGKDARRDNGRRFVDGSGGLFVDTQDSLE